MACCLVGAKPLTEPMLWYWTIGTNFSQILSEIHTFSFEKMHLKISSAKWWQFCLSLNVMMHSMHMSMYIQIYWIYLFTSENWGQVHDGVIKWKHFPRYWPLVRGIHLSPVNSPHKGQWRGALMFSLICAWINGWVNNLETGDLGRHHAHYDVTVMDGICNRTRPSLVEVMTWCLFSESWIKIQNCALRKINWKKLSA